MILSELTRVFVLLLHVLVMALLRGLADTGNMTASAATRGGSGGRHASQAMPPLQWRSPRWAWQSLAWAIATLSSPTFLLIGSLLTINSHSDHPLFWWSLPAIVAIGNAVAIVRIDQVHQREPFTDRQALARRHGVISTLTGATLFLLVGTFSSFLPDMVPALFSTDGVTFPVLANTLCSTGLAVAFAFLSFAFAGAAHAGIGFQAADVRTPWQREAYTSSVPGPR